MDLHKNIGSGMHTRKLIVGPKVRGFFVAMETVLEEGGDDGMNGLGTNQDVDISGASGIEISKHAGKRKPFQQDRFMAFGVEEREESQRLMSQKQDPRPMPIPNGVPR